MACVNGSLTDIRHLVFLVAEGVDAAERPELASRATACHAYHLTPEGEDRRAIWSRYAVDLLAAGYAVTIGSDAERLTDNVAADSLDDLTVVDVDDAGLTRVVDALGRAPEIAAKTLVLVALAGGRALPVVTTSGNLGGPGLLLLLSQWTPGGWVSEEVFDHTSVIRLCERWTGERGREVRAALPDWRREVCGDLVRVVELRAPGEIGPLPTIPGRELARPVPYFPVADVRIGESGVAIRLGNIGPVAASPAPFVVDDGMTISEIVVAGSPVDDQSFVRVPVTIEDGKYDVTVLGPNHFRRRFAGSFPDTGVHCSAEYFGRDPWFPNLVLTVWHDLKLPIFFWMEKRLGERAASKAAGYGSGTVERLPGPRQTARFKEEPGANTFGWYDVAVTTSADPHWIREYSGHMPTGTRPTLAY
jgi:phospholipase C